MKRDDDYIRGVLFEAEDAESYQYSAQIGHSNTEDELKKYYHAELLCDAGLFTQLNKGLYRMTSQGHDYLDAIRDEGIWKQTKDTVAKAGGSVALEFTKAVAMGFLKKKLAQFADVDL